MGFADALTWDDKRAAPAASRGLPAGVPANEQAAYNYVNSQSEQGIPATAAPTPSGGVDVLTRGSANPADLRAAEESPKTGTFADAMTWTAPAKTAQPVNVVPAPGAIEVPPKPVESSVPTLARPFVGGAETALSMLSGAVAAPIGAAAGLFHGLTSGKIGTQEGAAEATARAKEVMESLTYTPRSETGKDAVGTIANAIDASKMAGIGPSEAITLAGVMNGPARAVRPAAKPAAAAAESTRPMASVGAASATPAESARAMMANASPELRGVVENLVKKNQPIDLKTLARHAESESLPVPITLTKGQATQDVSLLSNEQNMRGKQKVLADRFSEQNDKLIQNTNAIRENAAPDVYATSAPEHGEMLIDAYKSKDAALNQVISQKYKALKDANGGNFPLDAGQFVKNADQALHKELLFDHVPPTIRKTLDRLSSDGMTFENFESLRTNLARIQRSTTADGNERAAAGVIRNALEDLPMPPGADKLKPLADEARAAAKSRFSLVESDPAYKAIVNGKASADKFVEKYIVNGDLKSVQTLMNNLSGDASAQQAVASGVVNFLKGRAGIIGDAGNFSQAGYNKALESLRPKLSIIFKPEQKQQLEALGNVARYTQAQPRGSFVNNSNTAVSLMAEGAKSAMEGAANVAAKGIPVGTWTRKVMQGQAEKRALREIMERGAGIQQKASK